MVVLHSGPVTAQPNYVDIVLFGPVRSVCPFGPAISWDTTRTLCLHGGCLSHPTSDMRDFL